MSEQKCVNCFWLIDRGHPDYPEATKLHDLSSRWKCRRYPREVDQQLQSPRCGEFLQKEEDRIRPSR